jgi:site-specific DNA-methyltransferase (adenine-specific)
MSSDPPTTTSWPATQPPLRSQAPCRILHGDCLTLLPTLPSKCARLIYIDPPFNTGKSQSRDRIRAVHHPAGDRTGFGGRRYRSEPIDSPRYADDFGAEYLAFLLPRIEASLHTLTPDGSLFVHLDWREVHSVKVALDRLLGRERFMNEIIWAYDYGGRPKNRWPAKHDTILWYAIDPDNSIFNYDAIDRIPYMAPGLVGEEKAARGKTPTDVWWHTIVPTNGREKTGYPTQKPLGILRRIIAVHTHPGDTVLDFFAGSGTTGAAAAELGRNAILIDESPEAVRIMQARLAETCSPAKQGNQKDQQREDRGPPVAQQP